MQPLISVIIPNRPTETNETLPSLERQTYKNLEIITIVDTDLKGASWARNEGYKKASGQYVFFCDNDLELEPDCIENLYNTLVQNPQAKWAFGKFFIGNHEFNRGKGRVPENKFSAEYIEYFHGISTMSLIDCSVNPHFDEEMLRYDDWDLWISLDRAGHSPVFCNKVLFRTKNRPGGISTGDNVKEWKDKLYAKHLKRKVADIIIPHHDQHEFLCDALNLLTNSVFNIIVVSGGTFAQNCNKGARIAETDNLIFLNDDTAPLNDLLFQMALMDEDIVGIDQFVPSMRRTFSGISYKKQGSTIEAFLEEGGTTPHMPSGYCFRVKRKAWEKLGGLDEGFRNGAEDVDIFLRAMQEGMTFGYIGKPMNHYLSKSTGRFTFARDNNILFKQKWPDDTVIKMLNL